MLQLHTRQIDTLYTTTTKRARKKEETNQKCRLGTASDEITGGGVQLVSGRPTLALSSALVPQAFNCSVCVEDSKLINALS